MVASNALPLPELTSRQAHKVVTARAKARAKLADDLKDRWTSCFEIDAGVAGGRKRAEPHHFFGAFASYGVAIYESLASVLLEHRPEIPVYENWLSFAAKTRVWEGENFAPWPETSANDMQDSPVPSPPNGSDGLWEEMMGYSWRISRHSQNSDHDSQAQQLILALQDPMGKHRSALLGFVHSALSERTLHLVARGTELSIAPQRTHPGLAAFQPAEEPGREYFLPEFQYGPSVTGWETLLETHGLSTKDVEAFDLKRELLHKAALDLKDSPRGQSGSWSIGVYEATRVGVSATLAVANIRFRELVCEYWDHLPADAAPNVFPQWLNLLRTNVLTEIRSVWTISDRCRQWYELQCKTEVEAWLSALQLQSQGWPKLGDHAQLERAKKSFRVGSATTAWNLPPYYPQPNPCYYFDRTEFTGLTAESRNEIVAGLLEIHSAFIENVFPDTFHSEPAKRAYDCAAKAFEQSRLLNLNAIEVAIPTIVFDAIACGMWCRFIYTEFSQGDRAPIQFGHVWTDQGWIDIFHSSIRGRITYWRAQLLRRSEEGKATNKTSPSVEMRAVQVSSTDRGAYDDIDRINESADPEPMGMVGANLVAVCRSIRPGKLSPTPKTFSTETEARSWQQLFPSIDCPEIPYLRYPLNVNFFDQGWNDVVPVRWLSEYAPAPPFTGSIDNLLPAGRRRFPDLPDLETKIENLFHERISQISCSLGEDWQFERIAIPPAVRVGIINLAHEDGLPDVVFEFLRRLEGSMLGICNRPPAAAVADFWQSWQTRDHIAAFCCELGRSGAAIQAVGSAQVAEMEGEKGYEFALQQLAAFAQIVVMRNSGVRAEGVQSAASPVSDGEEPNATERVSNPELSHAKVAKQSRAKTVALLIGELNRLKPQMLEDESEYARLWTLYPDFLAFKISADRPDLKLKLLAIRSSTRHVRLAQELAAAKHDRELSTIQDDWKDCKPESFRRRK